MSDNITANEITQFTSWGIPIVAAFLGAAVALIGREIIGWYKRPRLEIHFEKRATLEPYIADVNDYIKYTSSDYTHRIKYLRLLVRNKGKRPAIGCEVKLEVLPDGVQDASNKVGLHWSRNDPRLYSKYENGLLVSIDWEKVFKQATLNVKDEETVDVFKLDYHFSTKPDTDYSLKSYPYFESYSPSALQLQKNTLYECRVTVYSSNANPVSFNFSTNWNGNINEFNKAFQKSR